MITTLAPLGATHDIVLVLAYGEIPQTTKTGEPNVLLADCESLRDVCVTVHLKPRKSGNNRNLQFKGTAADVEAALKEQLPRAVALLQQHGTTLEQLQRELDDEQKKAQAEHEKKKESASNTVRAGVKSTTTYPAKKDAEKAKPEKKPAAEKPKGNAAEALAKLAAATAPAPAVQPAPEPTPAEAPAEAPSERSALSELERLAASIPTTDESVEL